MANEYALLLKDVQPGILRPVWITCPGTRHPTFEFERDYWDDPAKKASLELVVDHLNNPRKGPYRVDSYSNGRGHQMSTLFDPQGNVLLQHHRQWPVSSLLSALYHEQRARTPPST